MNQEDEEAETAFLSKIMSTGELTRYFLLQNAAEADSSPLKHCEMPVQERLNTGLPTTGRPLLASFANQKLHLLFWGHAVKQQGTSQPVTLNAGLIFSCQIMAGFRFTGLTSSGGEQDS